MQTTAKQVGCVDAATEVLGDKWTPILLRYFSNGEPVRFCQIQDLIGTINPRTLSARLDKLEQQGIISRESTTSERRCVYELTDKGRDLLPVLRSMENWSRIYG